MDERSLADTATQQSATQDNDLKKNLLSMISRSEDRRRKTRALPTLQGMKSPTRISKPELSLESPPENPKLATSPEESQTADLSLVTESLKNATSLEPEHSLSLSPVDSLTPKNSHAGNRRKRTLPLSPPGSLAMEHSLPTSPLDNSSKSDDFLPLSPLSPLQSPPNSLLQKSPESLERSPLTPLHRSGEGAEIELPIIVVPSVEDVNSPAPSLIVSETAVLPVDSSSSTEIEARNLVPLELEMESRENYALPASSDCSVDSDRSLPTDLGKEHTDLEEVIATSLPDLDNQYEAENTNQR